MARLADSERQRFLHTYIDWSLSEETITKTFVHSNFSEAIGFVARVALLAEVADHHPDIDIRWNKVTISLSTHDEDALTQKDTSLASSIEAL